MNVSTESGSLKVKAIYAESSCVSSCSGRVELGHAHGEQTAASLSPYAVDSVIESNTTLKLECSLYLSK